MFFVAGDVCCISLLCNAHRMRMYTERVSPGATLVTWSKEELEQFVAWMEENPEKLRGKQAVWHKDVKDQVFKNDEHVMMKRICDKAANMRRQWRDTSAMRNRSGWGISEDQNERSINQALEKKCAFWMGNSSQRYGNTASNNLCTTFDVL